MKNKIEIMRDKIEIWASLYSWDELTSDQQLLVGNEIGKKSYEKTWQNFQDLKQLDSPSEDFKALLMVKTRKTNPSIPWAYISGVAASLLIGIFIGSYTFTSLPKKIETTAVADTIRINKTDTLLLTQVDTIYQIKNIYRNVIQKEIVEIRNTNTSTNLDPNYKVPMPEYSIQFPRKDRKTKELDIDLTMDNEILVGVNL